MRLSMLLVAIGFSVASVSSEAVTVQLVKSDGTVYDCATAQGATPRYIIKSDGVIYDTWTGTEIEADSGSDNTDA